MCIHAYGDSIPTTKLKSTNMFMITAELSNFLSYMTIYSILIILTLIQRFYGVVSVNILWYTLGQYDLFFLAGVSALVAQFSTVDQFRWVGWFNMALGIVSLILLTILFHGEWKSPCMTKAKVEKVSTDHKKRCIEFFTKASTLKIIVSIHQS